MLWNCRKKLFFNTLLVQILLIAVAVGIISPTIYAQRCGTYQHHEQLKINNPALYHSISSFQEQLNRIIEAKRSAREHILTAETLYRIPVVVHIMHNSASGQIGGVGNSNITDAQILSQIEVLNEDFRRIPNTRGFNTNAIGADVMIEFCLADKTPNGLPSSGINRVYYSDKFFDYNNYDEEVKMKSMSYWPSDQYLNVWVTNLDDIFGYTIFPPNSSLPGLETYVFTEPTTDGCVIHYEAFGRVGQLAQYAEYGHTLTHEIGHWLGLLHIWGDSFCGNDYVNDTPTQGQSNFTLSIRCPATFSTCNGITTQDLNANYMDYSPDVCMNIFTINQKERMRTALVNSPRRAALIKNNKSCGNSVGVEEAEISSQNIQLYWKDNRLNIDSKIELSAGNIYIYNVMGVQLWKESFSELNTTFTAGFVPDNSQSLFMISIQTANGRMVKKISYQ